MALLLLAGTSASAQTPGRDYTFIGLAETSCGRWTEVRANGQSVPMQLWALGYVSGANAFTTEGGDFVKGTDAPAIYGWLDNRCRSQPLELFAKAVAALVNELKARAQ